MSEPRDRLPALDQPKTDPVIDARGELAEDTGDEQANHPRMARRRRVRGPGSGVRNAFPWFLASPSVLLVLLVTFLPIVQALQLSLHDTSFLTRGDFIGPDHYSHLFAEPLGRQNISNTFIFAGLSILLTFPISVGLALLLNRPFRGRAAVRTLLVLPWIVSQLLAALLWRWVLSPDIGPIAYWMSVLADARVDVFGTTGTAMLGLVLVNVWRTFPYAMILTMAALQTIPTEVLEAAAVDGAGPFQRLRSITLPMIKSTVLIALIILTINAVNMIELPLILTGGGPINVTDLLGLRVFREAFVLQNFGFASAVATVMFGINIIISLAYIRVLRHEQ